jgi:large subunit ribosomal protein L25
MWVGPNYFNSVIEIVTNRCKMNFTVQLREKTGKEFNKKLRQNGLTPGVIYGIKEPQPVKMDADLALRFIQSMQGTKKVFELAVESEGNTEDRKVLLQDYQLSNWGNKLIHADFLEVTDDTIVSLEVPIVIKNEDICPAIKEGGVIQVIRRSVPVKCAVKNIQEFIEIDLKDLLFGESVHVLDLNYDEGVEPVVYGRNFTIVTVAGRLEEEEEEVEEDLEELAAAEVEGEEKPEGEETAE